MIYQHIKKWYINILKNNINKLKIKYINNNIKSYIKYNKWQTNNIYIVLYI